MANYCTVDDIARLLPKAITIGENTLVNQQVIQTQGRANDITAETVKRYINFASQYIDSRLRPIYQMPLRRVKTVEQDLPSDVKAGTSTIAVADGGAFTQGSLVRIGDDHGSGLYSVKSYSDDPKSINTIELERKADRMYSKTLNGKISLVEYPDPIPLMCARYAVSMIIDKLFVGDQVPAESTFGKLQRTLASKDMDDLVIGMIKLQGQEHTGSRFARLSMKDAWKSPSSEPPLDRGKEG